jgi:tRNA pseudouridine65 synthase
MACADIATALHLPVLHHEDRFAVVAKPAGLMVHDSALARGETEFAADRLRAQFGQPVLLVHRLDRATSGCLLFAFDREAASRLGQSMMSREVRKEYLAVCRGWPQPAEGVIDHPLDGGPGKPQKKPARTHYRTLATGELAEPSGGFPTSRFALLACRPETGRFRQIRRHLRHAGHHLLGDTSHGDGQRNRIFRMRGIHRMLLHAWRLEFPHPFDGGTVAVVAPPDREFAAALALFGWTLPDGRGPDRLGER